MKTAKLLLLLASLLLTAANAVAEPKDYIFRYTVTNPNSVGVIGIELEYHANNRLAEKSDRQHIGSSGPIGKYEKRLAFNNPVSEPTRIHIFIAQGGQGFGSFEIEADGIIYPYEVGYVQGDKEVWRGNPREKPVTMEDLNPKFGPTYRPQPELDYVASYVDARFTSKDFELGQQSITLDVGQTVGFSSTDASNWNVEAGMEASAGAFGIEMTASVSAAYGAEKSKAEETQKQNQISTQLSFSTEGAQGTETIQYRNVSIPWEAQDLTIGNATLTIAKMKEPKVYGGGKIEIPYRDPKTGNVVSIDWRSIQQAVEILNKYPETRGYASAILYDQPNGQKSRKSEWIRMGYVHEGNAPPQNQPAGNGDMNSDVLTMISGTYLREPYENEYHQGQISKVSDGKYLWRNVGGVSWDLTLEAGTYNLHLPSDHPYAQYSPYRMDVSNGKVLGFHFGDESGGEYYKRTGD